MSRAPAIAGVLIVLWACGASAPPRSAPVPAAAPAGDPGATADATTVSREPLLPPRIAWTSGMMPLRSTGVLDFRAARPLADGRGVLIAVLDSGIDAGTYGLVTTSSGSPKLLDLRDFSGEGRVTLSPVALQPDGSVMVAGRPLSGGRRVGRVAVGDAWYGGVFREFALGPPPASDVDGNGSHTDEFPLVVVRASDGWVAFIDTNRNGSLEDEMPLHDFRHGHETLALGTRPLTLAANFAEVAGAPRLDLYFDTDGHGTAVAGVAAGHNLFNVGGFHGVAPGAALLGLKIADNARGAISVTGSIARAMEYAADFATQRRLPLVINLSFGVGNEREGRATIDSVIGAFLERHPAVVFVVAAGNDGPGLSTVGFPATADRVLTVGSTLPGAFARPGGPPPADRTAFWSARGGEVDKPDLVAPGMAYSAVPAWDVGNEVRLGTSLSAPHVAGLVACLISAVLQDGRRLEAVQIVQALRATAAILPEGSALDQGAGLPRVDAAYQWLAAGHQGAAYRVRAQSGHSAALRRDGLAGPADTVERFTVRHVAGQRAARFVLRSSAPWLRAPDTVVAAPGATAIAVTYRRDLLRAPGVYVGVVTARNPADTLAGPLFRLVNTIVVPYDLAARSLVETARVGVGGAVERRFLRVAQPGATLHVTVALPDSSTRTAFVALFEPGGQPARDTPLGVELGGSGGTARFLVRAGDLEPGVYELAAVSSPLGPPDPATVAIRAEVAPILLTAEPAGLELANPANRTVTVRVTERLIGAEASQRLAARGTPAESVWVRVPGWARQASVEVAVGRALWPELTDLAVTIYDSTGRQLANEPQNYAVGRQLLALDSSRAGEPLLVELMPAWADPGAARAWEAGVRVRFVGDSTIVLSDTADVRVVAGGRVALPRATARPPFVPEGLDPLVEVVASIEGAAPAVSRGRGGGP